MATDISEEMATLSVLAKAGTSGIASDTIKTFAFLEHASQPLVDRLIANRKFVATIADRIRVFRATRVFDTPDMWQVRHTSAYVLQRLHFDGCCFFIGTEKTIGRHIWCDTPGPVLCSGHERWITDAHVTTDAHLGPWLARICIGYIMPDYHRLRLSAGHTLF